MKLALMIFLLTVSSLMANSQICDCPREVVNGRVEGSANTIFSFLNGKKMGLCGGYEVDKNDTVYSDFCLFECGKRKAVYEWDGTTSCTVHKTNDTLIVNNMQLLPLGRNFSLVSSSFYIQHFFYNGYELKETIFFRKEIAKYSGAEIDKVIKKYRTLEKGMSDSIISVSNMLFWAYVSGSKEAEKYLIGIERKFGPFDGGIAEEWEDIRATYEHWKSLNGRRLTRNAND